MLKRLLVIAVAVAFAWSLAGGQAKAVHYEETVDGYIAEIYDWYGGKISKAQIREVAEDRADAMNMALIDVLAKVVQEATAAWPTHPCKDSDGVWDFSAKYKLKTAKRAGDIFVSTSGLAWFGHAGLYYTKYTVIHHPGLGKLSKKQKAKKVKVGCGSVMDKITIAAAKTKKAATYAKAHYMERKYNWMFPFYNKTYTPNGRVNCSQLVWLSFQYKKVNIDLDGNGGWAVYPWDLDRSALAKTYKVIRK